MIRRNCLFTKKFINGSRTKKYWETLSLRHAVFSRCKLLYSTDLGFKVMSDGQAKKMHSWNIRDLSELFECKEGNSQNKTKKQTLVCVFMRKKKKKASWDSYLFSWQSQLEKGNLASEIEQKEIFGCSGNLQTSKQFCFYFSIFIQSGLLKCLHT